MILKNYPLYGLEFYFLILVSVSLWMTLHANWTKSHILNYVSIIETSDFQVADTNFENLWAGFYVPGWNVNGMLAFKWHVLETISFRQTTIQGE